MTGVLHTTLEPDSDDAPPALLLVDDEPAILRALRRELRSRPYRVLAAASAKEALEVLERDRVGVVVSDFKMPEMNGVAFLAEVKARWPRVQRVMLTGAADQGALVDVINDSLVSRFLSKPWDPRTLLATIEGSFEQYATIEENARLAELAERQDERTGHLERAKREWEATFDAIRDPLAIVGGDHLIVRANAAYAQHAGVPVRDVAGRRCFELLAGRSSPCEGCPLDRALDGEPARGEDIASRAGSQLDVWAFPLERARRERESQAEGAQPGEAGRIRSAGFTPAARRESSPRLERAAAPLAVCHYRDITEERTLSEKLARTERLASLGLFVGGVAHEINNPLGGILAFTQLLLRERQKPDELKKTLEDIEASALRCKRIIESLMSFSHGSHFTAGVVEIGRLLDEAVSQFRHDYGLTKGPPRIGVEVVVEKGTPAVAGDPVLLHQLVRNLLVNAREAIGGEGSIRVVARSGTLEHPLGSGRIADAVELEVSDTGRGIPEDDVARIFDPFFTTKEDQKGSGLGLSICHRIVEQHEGMIEVVTQLGQGTTFRIVLRSAGNRSQLEEQGTHGGHGRAILRRTGGGID